MRHTHLPALLAKEKRRQQNREPCVYPFTEISNYFVGGFEENYVFYYKSAPQRSKLLYESCYAHSMERVTTVRRFIVISLQPLEEKSILNDIIKIEDLMKTENTK